MAAYDNTYGDFPDDQDELTQEGVGDLAPKRRMPPPQPKDLDKLRSTLADMPTPPHPGIWRRLLAGGVGGLAGAMNVNAGRPGGIARPVDPSGAINGILGMPQYEQAIADWKQRVGAQEKTSQLAEQARKDDLTAQEAEARIEQAKSTAGLNNTYRRDIITQRQQEEKRREQEDQQKYEASAPYTANDIGMPQGPPEGANNEFDDFPAGGPPQIPPGFVQAQAPPGYAGMPRFRATPEKAAEIAAKTKQDAEPKVEIDQDFIDTLTKAGIPVPGVKAGDKMPMRQYTQLNADLRRTLAAPKAAPQTADDLIALRAAGAATNIPEYDKYTPTQAAAAFRAKHPPTQPQVTFPSLPAAPAMQGAPGTRNEAWLQQQVDSGKLTAVQADTIRSIADYTHILPTGYASARYKDYYDPLFSAVRQYTGEQFDPKEYAARQAVTTDYMSSKRGSTGGNILSLNTLTGHLGTLVQDLQGLNNGDQRSLNSISNWLASEFGRPGVTNVDLAKTAVSAELATALKGVATEGEIKRWVDNIHSNMSPAQILGARKTLGDLMARRYSEINQAFYDKMGKPWRAPISSSAKRTLQQMGVDTQPIEDPTFVSSQATTPSDDQMLLDNLRKKHLGAK